MFEGDRATVRIGGSRLDTSFRTCEHVTWTRLWHPASGCDDDLCGVVDYRVLTDDV